MGGEGSRWDAPATLRVASAEHCEVGFPHVNKSARIAIATQQGNGLFPSEPFLLGRLRKAVIMGENKCGYSDMELAAAYFKHMSTTMAGKELGVSFETVRRALVRLGIKRDGRKLNNKGDRGCGGSPRKITDEELIEESKTMSRSEIAEKHNMCICNIDRKLHRLGIKCVPENRVCGTNRKQGGKYFQRIKAAGYDAEYDPTITLKKVLRKYDGICCLCGRPVDTTDKIRNRVGSMYPSIDHIIPICRGGSHTWNNVQLAHKSCNSLKGTEAI